MKSNVSLRRRFLVAPVVAGAFGACAWLAAGLPAAGAATGSPVPAAHTAVAGVTDITNFVKYVDGKPGSANPKLAPALIGWSSNDSGGSVVSVGPEASAAAQLAVNWINKYAGGIGGHPLMLDSCIVKNAEEEGLACAQGFLNNPKVSVVSFGALSVGAQTEDATIAGKKPIIQGFSLNNSDVVTPNEYILFGPGPFAIYPTAQFAKQYLHATTAAVIYPNEAGLLENAQGLKLTDAAAGIKTTTVAFDPTTSDLTGALTAAHAQTAGMVFLDITDQNQCLAAGKAINTLGISPTKVVGFSQCDQPAIKSQYPGGDYPHFVSNLSQSGSALVNDPTGVAFANAVSKFGPRDLALDDWYSGMFGQILTIAQFMNKVGYSHLSPAAIKAQVKAFTGPLLLGSSKIQCGKYPAVPAACSDSVYYFRYNGNGKWSRASGQVEPPLALQKQLLARKPGSGFPVAK